MQKKLFSIEWPNEYGPDWLKDERVLQYMTSSSYLNPDIELVIKDVTIPEPPATPTLGGHDF